MSLYIYFSVMIVLLIVIVILFNSLDYALSTGSDTMLDMINDTPTESLYASSTSSISTVKSVWMYFPVLLIILVIIWSLVHAQRQE